MLAALQTLKEIPRAGALVDVRLKLMVFVRGSLTQQRLDPDALWELLREQPFASHLNRFRRASETHWRLPPGGGSGRIWSRRAGLDPAACVEFAGDGQGGREALSLKISDLAPALGMERASHVVFDFPSDSSGRQIAEVARWLAAHVPVLWGTGGWSFEVKGGSEHVAARTMIAQARRHWSIQILETSALQWEALRGMPGVNWLTLVGDAFAAEHGIDAASLAGLAGPEVFVHRGRGSTMLAAGAAPLRGDIHADESLAPLVTVAQALKPALLTSCSPMFGQLADEDVMNAWLQRFIAPQAWLKVDVE
ncbi:type VI immunity family protein [Roseateles sp. L2-2]|uniref:type VI immunity family protein n=1 Tax=Roseateles TaxID=93681 RepID=UPI003D368656